MMTRTTGLVLLSALLLMGAKPDGAGDQTHDPHAHHRHMMAHKGNFQRKAVTIDVPDVPVVASDGSRATLGAVLKSDAPVMVSFIFTTCTTICPVLTATFSEAQRQLGDAHQAVRMVSITIDPEQDTPARLAEYRDRFKAQPGWQFYTGQRDDIVSVQRAFDIYRGDKMNHPPVAFLEVGGKWTRFEGFPSGKALAEALLAELEPR